MERKHVSNLLLVGYLILLSECKDSSLDHVWIKTMDIGNLYIRQHYVSIVSMSTDVMSYGIKTVNRSNIIFSVKACQQCLITLVNDERSYTLILGRNENTKLHIAIARNNTFEFSPYYTSRSGILDCNEFRTFWLSWENLSFRLGRGNVLFTDEIYRFDGEHDPSFSGFTRVLISTRMGEDGLWIFENDAYPNGRFYGSNGKRSYMRQIYKSLVMSYIECSILCDMNKNCFGYNYNSLSNECELLDGNQLISTTDEEKWKFMAKCLQGSLVCLQRFN